MSTAAASDPFETTANPDHYVRRPAAEEALEALQRGVVEGGQPQALTGPTGLGKTQLLQVLGQRLAHGFRVVQLPYPALSGAELCAWVLDALGEPAGDDPEGALLDLAFRASAEGREILLLIDDASALPPGSARSLSTLIAASGGAVRAVLAAGDDARTGPTLAALGAGLREIRLEAPMGEEETAEYVHARLARCDAGDGARVRRFDADTVARLHAAAGGVPRLVHELGSVVWRAPEDADLAGSIDAWQREHEGREAEMPAEEIEIDEGAARAPVLEIEAEPPASSEAPSEEIGAASGPLEPEPPAEIAEPVAAVAGTKARRRPGALWVAILVLIVAVPYLVPRIEAMLAREGATARIPAETAPAAPQARPVAEPEAPEPMPAPPLLPDEAPQVAVEEVASEEAETPIAGEPGTPVPTDPATAASDEAGTQTADTELPPESVPAPSSDAAPPEDAAMAATEPEEPASDTAPAPVEPDPAANADLVAEPTPPAPAAETAAGPAPEATSEPAPPPTPAPKPRRVAPQPPPVLVNVDAIPSALIHVDGSVIGETPLAGLPLAPGLHVFRAEFPGGRAVVRAVEISGENRHVHFE